MQVFEQFLFFNEDIQRLVGKKKIRFIHIWMSRLFIGIFYIGLNDFYTYCLGSPMSI
jgi:hypothetical protein